MLTKKDRQLLLEDFKKVFATKEDLKLFVTKKEFKKELGELRNDLRMEIIDSTEEVRSDFHQEMLSFKDEILHEIRGMRDELAIVIGYRQHIENHDERIEKIEHHLGFS